MRRLSSFLSHAAALLATALISTQLLVACSENEQPAPEPVVIEEIDEPDAPIDDCGARTPQEDCR